MRPQIAEARRVVVKVGSSSLTGADGRLDTARVDELARLLSGLQARGARVVLVTSGAIAAAIGPLGLRRRPRDLETQQAAAAVGQGLLVRAYSDAFAEHGVQVAQLLLTVEDVLRPSTYRNALNTISRLFRLGVVPIVNENDTVATHEIRFGDNDRLAALIAHLVRADALFLMSDVDGLYTAHPDTPGAERISRVDDISKLAVDTSRVGSKVGTGGMRTMSSPRTSPHRRGSPSSSGTPTSSRPHWPVRRSARCSRRGRSAGPGDCCGWRSRPSRAAGCMWTRARRGPSSAVTPRCWRRGSAR